MQSLANKLKYMLALRLNFGNLVQYGKKRITAKSVCFNLYESQTEHDKA
jgi:hypothetical protein